MDRLSTDANILPCLRAANPRLARAIEGAAENKPAKLFGFKASPKAANKQTTAPPIRNRNTYCMAAASGDRIGSPEYALRLEAAPPANTSMLSTSKARQLSRVVIFQPPAYEFPVPHSDAQVCLPPRYV